MESLARLVMVMVLVLLGLGPFALALSYLEKMPFFTVVVTGLLSIVIGVYWTTIPTAARWMGLIPIVLGAYAIYRRLDL